MVETFVGEVDLVHKEFQVQEFPPEVETSNFESTPFARSEAFQSPPRNLVSETQPTFSCSMHAGSWHRSECDTLQVLNELLASRNWTFPQTMT